MNESGLVDKLIEGCSTQSKVTNQFWIILILASIISLTGNKGQDNMMELPLTLGKVNMGDFYKISIILISALIIAFSSAMIQTIRTRRLIKQKSNNPEAGTSNNLKINEYLDNIISPTYNRVSPISLFILDLNQSRIGNIKIVKHSIIYISAVLYIVFKVSTYIFLYALPIFAIYNCCENLELLTNSSKIPIISYLTTPLITLSMTAIFILIAGDLLHTIGTIRKMVLQ